MSRQTFRDESNYKHEPHVEHNVDDKFEKGTKSRNWKKNIKKEDENEEDFIEEEDIQTALFDEADRVRSYKL